MFDIHSVTLDNFRSFKGRHVIAMPANPGLYLITGKNEVEPRLTSNGCGKSTLFDAIYWCLYGRTTRGLKANDVINWDAKSCSVSVQVTVGDQPLEITRVQSPNSLTMGQRLVEQRSLEKYLRLGPEAFLYAVLMPQFGNSFFDLSPAEKLTVFSEIMELDFWLQKAKQAEELSKELLAQKANIELERSRVKGQLEASRSDLKGLEQRNTEFANNQKELVLDYKKQLAEVQRNGLDTAAAFKFSEDAITNIKRKQVGNALCPACQQPLPNPTTDGLARNMEEWQQKLNRLQREQDRSAAEQHALEQQIRRELERQNPYAEQLTQKQGKIKAAKQRLGGIGQELLTLESDQQLVSYWGTGFKRIRLFIIEETLRRLEIEVNNSMNSLGLTGWRIEFDVERENKSGGITKGFTVFVTPPGRKDPVRLEAYSGGETQRLYLAGDLGLANLIMERAGLAAKLECFDEPASYLSEEGLIDVADTLHDRAISQGKRILLCDHAAIDFADFAARLLITKDADGSRFSLV